MRWLHSPHNVAGVGPVRAKNGVQGARARRLLCILVIPVLLLLCACAKTPRATPPATGKVTISYDLLRLNRIASNQLAVWIEDEKGNYVKTIYATAFMAKGGYRSRPECCPTWVKAAGWKDAAAAEVDAVSGPTQKAGRITLAWDCRDRSGKPVPPATYVVKLEGTIFWENRVIYEAPVSVGGARVQVKPAPEYSPAAAKDVGEMVKNVVVEFIP